MMPLHEQLEIFHHNPVECIHELIGNLAFHDVLKYVPERLYTDEMGEHKPFARESICP